MSSTPELEGLLRSHNCGQLRASDIDKEVCLCGWVNKKRDLGGLHFIDLRDKHGLTQLNFSQYAESIDPILKISLESVIKVKGVVRKRPEAAINQKMPTGEVEVIVRELEVLSKAKEPPFLPSAKTQASEDLKLKYRYLDFRSEHLQKMLSLRSEMMKETRTLMYELGFTEVETPILYKTTPEGARDYIVPSRVHPGKVYALPQSPQTLKQLLMIGSTDKYFQICRCFRDEDLRADRQPEFTQLDVEVSFATPEYIRNLASELLKKWFELGDEFVLPRMSYEQALRDYGSDKPDLRYGLKQYDVTSLFKDSSFGLFSSLANQGGMIKCMFVPETMGSFSRKQVDSLVDVVKPFGCGGVAFFKVSSDNLSGGISKFITDEILVQLKSRIENFADGTYLFVAHEVDDNTHAASDALRRFLAKEFKLTQGKPNAFLWIEDFPLFEYSEDDRRFVAKHHPFTMHHSADHENFMNHTKLKEVRALAYDVVCNGYELGGGSVRIHQQDVQEQMFKCLGMSKQEAVHQFGFFIEALQYGTPPHAGIAFGFDRLCMLKAQTDNIRDVIAFPKTTKASDLMAEAPSLPNKEQLKELGLIK